MRPQMVCGARDKKSAISVSVVAVQERQSRKRMHGIIWSLWAGLSTKAFVDA
jgi:hypothetical protein